MSIFIVTVFIIVVAGFLSYVATRPNDFRIERKIVINVTPEKIFPLIDNFQQWEDWSPLEKVDPDLLRSYSGAACGKGAVYVWQGNREVGVGRMEIIESAPPSLILIKIDFEEPMTAHHTIKFDLKPQGQSTKVTQAMYGPSPFLAKLMGLFFNMEKMVGGKFEEGLAGLKALAEKAS